MRTIETQLTKLGFEKTDGGWFAQFDRYVLRADELEGERVRVTVPGMPVRYEGFCAFNCTFQTLVDLRDRPKVTEKLRKGLDKNVEFVKKLSSEFYA